MRFDGSASGYVFAALIGSIAGFSIAQQTKGGKDKGAKQHKADHKSAQHATTAPVSSTALAPATGPSSFPTASFVSGALPFSSPPIQPWTPSTLDDGSAAPSLPLLTALSAEQVASHPLLQAIGPYGLPSLPFRSSSGGAPSPSFHLSPPLILRQGFLSAWNSKTRTPDWCLQLITDAHQHSTTAALSSSALDVSRDNSSFNLDPLIASAFQPSSSAYRHSGWDRGHMVPAADVSAAHVGGQDALDESFQWSNICPQDSRLNRGYWAQLEHHVRKLARSKGKKRGDNVFVVTGPLWIPEQVEKPAQRQTSRNNNDNASLSDDDSLLPPDSPALSNGTSGVGLQLRTEVLGSVPSGFVTVPTHFFKVVLVAPADSSASSSSAPLQLAAFIVPNAPVPLTTPLRAFQVPLEHVEQQAGWQMFGRLQRANGKRGNNSQVRDLCAAGGCELKIKDFAFNRKQAQAL